MRPSDQLSQFVRDALIAGKPRDQIEDALKQAGWAYNEARNAMESWADQDFAPPIPRPRPYLSAKEAFFYGLMFAALAMMAWHLTALSFNLIDRWQPDSTETHFRSYKLRQIRWSIASLIVFSPLFFILNTRVVRATKADPGKRRSGVRKWFSYITLFLAAASLLGALLWVVYALLEGDLTTRVICKAVVVAVVAGAIFSYFRRETEGD